MQRLDAHRVWLGYRGLEAFAFGLGWTVAPIFFVRELGLWIFSIGERYAKKHGKLKRSG